MRIVVAPDSFKGSLDAASAAAAMAAGVARAVPGASVVTCPIADGGEGTVAAFLAAGATAVTSRVHGPLGAPVSAVWARRATTAVIEAAAANGLHLVTPSAATALAADTGGVGDLVLAALDADCTEVVLGVGGSASTDAGTGMARALGVHFTDTAGVELPPGGGELERLWHVDRSALDPRVAELTVTVACDVDSPLTGPSGAAAVFGPQKGAGPAEVARLDHGLARWAAVLAEGIQTGAVEAERVPAESVEREGVQAVGGRAMGGRASGRERADPDLARRPGSGAAGGLAAGAIAFLGARLTSGADLVLDLIGIDTALREADLVIVGEGSLDAQSLRGTGPGVLAARARAAGVPVLAVAGVVDLTPEQLHAAGIERAVALLDVAVDPADSRLRAAELVTVQTSAVLRWWIDRRSQP